MNALLDAVPPDALARAIVVGFGLVLGSFLNVVVHRLPRGASVVTPRSACPACGRLIRWYENVPVLSWIALRARCAGCGARISWRYPLVEALTAALFLACFEAFGWTRALPIALLLVVLVVALVFIDLDHFLLPDALTLPGTAAGLALSYVSPLVEPADALLGVLVSVVAIEGMNLAYRVARGVDGFGAGDTKMMMMVGAFLGWGPAVFSLFAGSVIGSLVGIPLAALARRRAPPAPEAPAAPPPGPAPEPDAPAVEAEPPPSTWRDVLPRSVHEAVPVLVLVVLGASFVSPVAAPESALAGALAGIAAMTVVDALVRRGGREWPWTSLLPLAGAAAGVPPTPGSAIVAAVLVGAVAIAGARSLAPRALAARDAIDAEEADALPVATSLMQAALPFGVFLGAGALVALFAYDDVVGLLLPPVE